ncbi:MAG: hypothetical protein ACRC0S_04210 [Fusobacteriaceae bacterium]
MAYYSEAACGLILSIDENKRNLMIVNVHNNGIIKAISDDSVIAQLSLSAGTDVSLTKFFKKLVINAAINCDYGKALQALTKNI